MKRLEIVKKVLAKLAQEFNVEKPHLFIKPMKTLHGYYVIDEITLNSNTLRDNLSMAVKTVRHEFYHYLEDILSLDSRKSEVKARRFEKNILSLNILPKSQKKLCGDSKK